MSLSEETAKRILTALERTGEPTREPEPQPARHLFDEILNCPDCNKKMTEFIKNLIQPSLETMNKKIERVSEDAAKLVETPKPQGDCPNCHKHNLKPGETRGLFRREWICEGPECGYVEVRERNP